MHKKYFLIFCIEDYPANSGCSGLLIRSIGCSICSLFFRLFYYLNRQNVMHTNGNHFTNSLILLDPFSLSTIDAILISPNTFLTQILPHYFPKFFILCFAPASLPSSPCTILLLTMHSNKSLSIVVLVQSLRLPALQLKMTSNSKKTCHYMNRVVICRNYIWLRNYI